MNIFKFIVVCVLSISSLAAQEKLLINTYNRSVTSLNGYWKYIVDPYENGFYNYRYQPFENQKNPGNGAYFTNAKAKSPSDLIEYDFDASDSLHVPGDWNTQKEKLYYYEGTIWYKKSFDYIKRKNSNRVFVYFEAANYQADVYLNGKKLGRHTGGFTPFNFEVTQLLKDTDNFLVVKVDNKRIKEGVPTLNTDWWNYGGLTRGVKLMETASNFIQDYFIQLDPKNKNHIAGHIALSGKDIALKKIQLQIPDLKIRKTFITDNQGIALISVNHKNINYWSPSNPHIYKVILKTDDEPGSTQI